MNNEIAIMAVIRIGYEDKYHYFENIKQILQWCRTEYALTKDEKLMDIMKDVGNFTIINDSYDHFGEFGKGKVDKAGIIHYTNINKSCKKCIFRKGV